MIQNLLIASARIAASTVLGAIKSLVVNLEGIVGDSSNEEPMFSALGVVTRPKAPVPKSSATGLNPEGECEALTVKNEDGMQPFSYRDLRTMTRLPSLSEGDVFLSGYQGGYVAVRDTTGALGSKVTLYAPRLNSSGVETAAHSIVLDPHASSNPAIAITHGGGYSIRILNNGTTELRSTLVVDPDNSPQGVMLSTDMLNWITQVNTVMTALNSAVGGNVPPIVVPSAVPIASSKLSAAP